METDGKKMHHLEDLLIKLGGTGRFQFSFLFGMFTIYSVTGWSMMQMMYSGLVPTWRCGLSQQLIQETETEALGESHNISAPAIISEQNDTMNVCSINGTRCEKYIFLTSSRTIVNEWNLICDRKWVKQIVISLQMCGVWLGAVISGQLGDRYGRRKPFYSFALFHVIMNILAGFSVNWEMFAIFRFLIGTAVGGLSVLAYPYLLELFPARNRKIPAHIPFYGIGICIFSGVAACLDNWSHLHFACAVFSLPHLLGWFYFPDSIRWLAVHGRLEEAMTAVKRIARLNGKPVPTGTMVLLKMIAQEEQEIRQSGRAYSYLDLFKHSFIRNVTSIHTYFWFSMTTVFFGISFGISSLDGNIFLNTFLLSFTAVASSFPFIFIGDSFKRRTLSLVFSFMVVITSVGCIITSLVPTGGKEGAIINGLSLTASSLTYPLWNTITLWGLELLPTVVRNLGYGWFNSGSRVAGIVLPFVMNFDDSLVIPHIVIAVLLLVCFILCFFLPETRGHALPDSLSKTVSAQSDKCTYSIASDVDQAGEHETSIA